MPQDVYVDILFLINFSMDYLCFYICSRIMHRKIRFRRLLLASLFGGTYSVLALFLPISGFVALLADLVCCILLCIAVYYEKGRRFSSALLCAFVFFGISMMMGGCMTAIFNLLNSLDLPLDGIKADGLFTYIFAILAVIAGFISLRSGEIISKHSSAKECKLNVAFDGKEIICQALVDSGNLVKDPLSGKSVILIDRSKLSALAELSELDNYACGTPTNTRFPSLRIIPIKTASGTGLLTAFVPQKIVAELTDAKLHSVRIELDALIAPSDIKNSAKGCDAIISNEILKI